MATAPNYLARYTGRNSLFGNYGMGGLMGNIMPLLLRKAQMAAQKDMEDFERQQRAVGMGKKAVSVPAGPRGSILERARKSPAPRMGGGTSGSPDVSLPKSGPVGTGGQPPQPPGSGGGSSGGSSSSNWQVPVNQPGYWESATERDQLGKSIQMGTGGVKVNIDAGTVTSPTMGTSALGAENKIGVGQSPFTPTPGAPISPGKDLGRKPPSTNNWQANAPYMQDEGDDGEIEMMKQRLLGFTGSASSAPAIK